MTLVYLYAIAPRRGEEWLRANPLRGIADAPVRAIASDAVVGAVSDVSAAEFDQAPLDRNVADASWLAPHAAAHQDVNARLLAGLGAVLPLSFGTLFRGEDRVREILAARGDELVAALARVAARAEWVLTLERDRAIALRHLEQRAPAVEAAPPGRAYLQRQKRENALRDELRRLDAEAADALRDAVAGLADEQTDEPLIEGGPVARVTALVPHEREAALAAAADAFGASWGARGYAVRTSGPWPAYRAAAGLGSLRG